MPQCIVGNKYARTADLNVYRGYFWNQEEIRVFSAYCEFGFWFGYILAKLVSSADKVGGLEYSFRPFYYSHIDKSKRSFTRAASGIFGPEWNRTLVCINGNIISYCNYYQGNPKQGCYRLYN